MSFFLSKFSHKKSILVAGVIILAFFLSGVILKVFQNKKNLQVKNY